jgi:cystathionine beta-synthase
MTDSIGPPSTPRQAAYGSFPGAASDLADLVGRTPMLRLDRLSPKPGVEVYLKLEMLNPTGSVKDRAAAAMFLDAEKDGTLRPGCTLVEYTSGNLGLSLAALCAARGYKCVLVTHNIVSKEKIRLLRSVGARVVVGDVTLPPGDPHHPKSIVERLAREIEGSVNLNQYENQENPRAHYLTTGPEIYRQTNGRITHLFCTIGTGGTISGVGRFLKEQNPTIQVVAVEPEGSIVSSEVYGQARPTRLPSDIEAIGQYQDIYPTTWLEFVDDVVSVDELEASEMALRIPRETGILAGWSSGAALAGFLKYVQSGRSVQVAVVVMPDGAARYLEKLLSVGFRAMIGASHDLCTAGDLLGLKPEPLRLITARSSDTLGEVLGLSMRHAVRHIPIEVNGRIVGKVERRKLVELLTADPQLALYPVRANLDVSSVPSWTDPPYPVVGSTARIREVVSALRSVECVIVETEGKPIGLLSRSDLTRMEE